MLFSTYDDFKASGLLFDGEYARIPEDMRDAMIRYVEEKTLPGDFLQAVITNDLLNAVCRADNRNISLLKQYVHWFYNIAPQGCYGSFKKMKEWTNG